VVSQKWGLIANDLHRGGAGGNFCGGDVLCGFWGAFGSACCVAAVENVKHGLVVLCAGLICGDVGGDRVLGGVMV